MPTTDHLSSPYGGAAAEAGAPAEAFTALFRAHAARLVHAAVLLTSDEELAEEVVQDAFLGLHRR